MADLSNVDSRVAARRFARDSAKLVRRQERQVPEFYVPEFLDILKDTLVARCSAESDELQQALDYAKMEADVATVELTARLEAASAAGDRNAQHEIWKEREKIQVAVQGKVDASGAAADALSARLDAFKRLASTLGVTFT
jgi:hypothetical protein